MTNRRNPILLHQNLHDEITRQTKRGQLACLTFIFLMLLTAMSPLGLEWMIPIWFGEFLVLIGLLKHYSVKAIHHRAWRNRLAEEYRKRKEERDAEG